MGLQTLFSVAMLAMSAVAAPAAPEPVSQQVWSDIVRYTKFCAASYPVTLGATHTCRYPPYNSTLVRVIDINRTDTQAAIFRDAKAKEYIVTFPGTTTNQDFDTDYNITLVPYKSAGVNCAKCKAHGGFLLAWNSIIGEVRKTLDASLKKDKSFGVTVTGHSLGGALAALSYVSLKGLDYPVKRAYTYGMPRIGDVVTANYIDKLSGASKKNIGNFRRVTHSYDGVPNLPPTGYANYTHPLTEIFQRDIYKTNGTLVPKARDNDNITSQVTQVRKATFRCFGHDNKACNTGWATGFINNAHLHYSGIQLIGGTVCNQPDA